MEIKITNRMIFNKINENEMLDKYIDTLESFMGLEKEIDYKQETENSNFSKSELICGKEFFYDHIEELLYLAKNFEFFDENENLKYAIGKFNFMNNVLLRLLERNIDFSYEESVAIHSLTRIVRDLYDQLSSIQKALDNLEESLNLFSKKIEV